MLSPCHRVEGRDRSECQETKEKERESKIERRCVGSKRINCYLISQPSKCNPHRTIERSFYPPYKKEI